MTNKIKKSGQAKSGKKRKLYSFRKTQPVAFVAVVLKFTIIQISKCTGHLSTSISLGRSPTAISVMTENIRGNLSAPYVVDFDPNGKESDAMRVLSREIESAYNRKKEQESLAKTSMIANGTDNTIRKKLLTNLLANGWCCVAAKSEYPNPEYCPIIKRNPNIMFCGLCDFLKRSGLNG